MVATRLKFRALFSRLAVGLILTGIFGLQSGYAPIHDIIHHSDLQTAKVVKSGNSCSICTLAHFSPVAPIATVAVATNRIPARYAGFRRSSFIERVQSRGPGARGPPASSASSIFI